MSYSPEICACITRFLESDNWKYVLDEKREVIKSGMGIEGKMKRVDILFDLRDDKYLLYFTCPLSVDEAERPQMRELMNRINYDLMFGGFEMDERDGEVRFRYSVDCDGVLPTQAIVKHSLYRSALTMNKYGDAIIKVLMGFATAEEAYLEANKNDD